MTALLSRLLKYTDQDYRDISHALHNIHPYPAKYIPELPRDVILEHTNERHTVLDPFCGSGTTLLEASLNGRRSIGIDSNPIACLISKAKTNPLSIAELDWIDKFSTKLSVKDLSSNVSPNILQNQDHWFSSQMAQELYWLRKMILSCPFLRAHQFLECVFSSIIVSVSNQDSETRYVAVPKNHPRGYAIDRFLKKLRTTLHAMKEYSQDPKIERVIPQVVHASTGNISKEILKDNSVDLVITSPPYPNSFDYYLYHKLRMTWLGLDWKKAQNDEIGSRYEHSSRKAPIDVFIRKIQPALEQVQRILKPSKLFYLFVGDSVLAGQTVDMEQLYTEILIKIGMQPIGATDYSLNAVSLSFKDTRYSAGTRKNSAKRQRILVFENTKTASGKKRVMARPIAQSAGHTLGKDIQDGSTISINQNKDSRHIHSLISFPSKFIPEIPAWAIQNYSKKGATVLDPFSGSGTTAVEALIQGRNAISVDVNPFATLLSTSKTQILDEQLIRGEFEKLVSILTKGVDFLPSAKPLDFPLHDFWFEERHLEEFARIKKFIETQNVKCIQPLLLTTLASTIRQFSFQDSGQIKVKRDPKKVVLGTPTPIELLKKKLPRVLDKYIEFINRADKNCWANSLNISAIDYSRQESTMRPDLIITSPPYINAMNYSMATRYEMLLLGLVPFEELLKHQTNYFGTERVYSKEYSNYRPLPANWSCSSRLEPILKKIFQAEPKRWYISHLFFLQMRDTFANLTKSLKPQGHFVLVAGTNTIKNNFINTFDILASFLNDAGLERCLTFRYEIIKQKLKITRHKTAKIIPFDGVAVFKKTRTIPN